MGYYIRKKEKMIISDIELNSLRQQQGILNTKEFLGEITYNEFEKRILPIEEKIKVRTKEILKVINQKQKERFKEIEVNQKETLERKKYTTKIERKPKEGSYASIIEQVLLMPGINNLDKAIKKANELKPGRDYDRTKAQIRAIIQDIEKGQKARWLNYTWNEKEFVLTKK